MNTDKPEDAQGENRPLVDCSKLPLSNFGHMDGMRGRGNLMPGSRDAMKGAPITSKSKRPSKRGRKRL